MFKVTIGGEEFECTSFEIKTTLPPAGPASCQFFTTGKCSLEMDMQTAWTSYAMPVLLDLMSTVNFDECDKQAIANPWYSGWGTR